MMTTAIVKIKLADPLILLDSYADITDRIEVRVAADYQQYSGMLRELNIERDVAARTVRRVGEEEFGLHLDLLDWRRTDYSPLDPIT